MRHLVALALLAMAMAPASAQAQAWQLERSEVHKIEAEDGHAYSVSIAWPQGDAPEQGWPVLWVLDGADNFAIAALTARRLARAGERSGIHHGVVVGIDSGPLTRRIFDYTPRLEGYEIPAGLPGHGHMTGGSQAFLALVRQSIVPVVARNVPIDNARQTLLGHSFGAVLALEAMEGEGPWSRFAVVSPSLWFGDEVPVTRIRPSGKVGEVLIALGDGETSRAGTEACDAAERLRDRLAEHGIASQVSLLSGHDHGTTMLAAMGQAIALAFGEEGRK
ncbi:alpha/beta hydrolase [Alteraurantiacibacter aquimixticola]|uniref:alpha/beta hydrolase n=1 Tax=Alteraurantiacibacter aquimixticola TaxID=2489173 RepID=UPI00145B9D2D|nr:alpha/beta hydrolase-fold protein [Alteraurantiacibacter aquimixticola]